MTNETESEDTEPSEDDHMTDETTSEDTAIEAGNIPLRFSEDNYVYPSTEI
jgi:hypothetical protein